MIDRFSRTTEGIFGGNLLKQSSSSLPLTPFLSILFLTASLPPSSPSFLSILPRPHSSPSFLALIPLHPPHYLSLSPSPSFSSLALSLLPLSSSLPLSFLPLNPHYSPCFLSLIPIHPPHYLSPSFLSVILTTCLPPSSQSSSPPLHPSFLSIRHLITSPLFPVILSSTSLPLSFFRLHPLSQLFLITFSVYKCIIQIPTIEFLFLCENRYYRQV